MIHTIYFGKFMNIALGMSDVNHEKIVPSSKMKDMYDTDVRKHVLQIILCDKICSIHKQLFADI
jgi:hypothetical protein